MEDIEDQYFARLSWLPLDCQPEVGVVKKGNGDRYDVFGEAVSFDE